MKKKILFICTGNSCRSQMAEGIARNLGWNAFSAGINPALEVNPFAVKVMQDIGINISEQSPESIDKYTNEDFDIAVTLYDNACAFYSGKCKKIIHRGFKDPFNANGTDKQKLEVYAKIRDEIQLWIQKLDLDYE